MARSVLLVVALFFAAVGRTKADYLYDNGPIKGDSLGGLDIEDGNPAFVVSDRFTLAAASRVTGAQVGLWTSIRSTPATVQWSVGTTPFGSEQGSGTAPLTSTFHNNWGSSNIYASTFPLDLQLGSGAYWLTLQNATASQGTYGSYVLWDRNIGPSEAIYGFGGSQSESFQIIGTVIPSPEPSSMILLGIGIAGLAAYSWRTRAKSR